MIHLLKSLPCLASEVRVERQGCYRAGDETRKSVFEDKKESKDHFTGCGHRVPR